VVILMLVLLRYGVDFYLAYVEELQQRTDFLAQQAEHLTRIAALVPETTRQQEALEQRFAEIVPQLIPGDNPQLAAAILIERISTLAEQEQLQVFSTQVMGEQSAGPFRRITVQILLQGELAAAARLISALEFGPWRLSITSLELRRLRSVATDDNQEDAAVNVTLRVGGLVRGSVQAAG
jgi:hypothetical protein